MRDLLNLLDNMLTEKKLAAGEMAPKEMSKFVDPKTKKLLTRSQLFLYKIKNNLPFTKLDKTSIGIEICNWGYLVEKNGKFINYVGKEVKDVCKLDKPYKGFIYFENYTKEQIASVKELLLLWREKYGIDLTYHEDIWQVTKRALSGKNGVFTHNSVRADKIDVYPHPDLISMLQSL